MLRLGQSLDAYIINTSISCLNPCQSQRCSDNTKYIMNSRNSSYIHTSVHFFDYCMFVIQVHSGLPGNARRGLAEEHTLELAELADVPPPNLHSSF